LIGQAKAKKAGEATVDWQVDQSIYEKKEGRRGHSRLAKPKQRRQEKPRSIGRLIN